MHCAMRAFPLLPCTEIPTGQSARLHACARTDSVRAALKRKERVHAYSCRTTMHSGIECQSFVKKRKIQSFSGTLSLRNKSIID